MAQSIRRVLPLFLAAGVLLPAPGLPGRAAAAAKAGTAAGGPSGTLSEQRDCADVRKQLAIRVAELAEASSQLADVAKLLAEAQLAHDREEATQAAPETLRGLLVALEGRLKGAEALQRQSEQELYDATVQSAACAALLSKTSGDLQARAAETDAFKQDLERRGAEAASLQAQLGQLEAKVAELERAAQQRSVADAGKSEAAAEFRRQKDALERQLKDLKEALAGKDEQIAAQQTQVAAAKEQADDRDAKIAGLTKDLAAARERVAALAPLEKQLKELRAALAERDQDLAKLRKDRDKELAELNKERDSQLAEVKKDRESELARAKKDRDAELAKARQDRETELAEARKDRDAELARARKAGEEIAGLTRELKASREAAAALAPLERKVAGLEKDLTISRAEVAALAPLERELKDLRESLAERDAELAGLDRELSTSRLRLTSLQAQMEEKDQTTLQLVRKARESVSRLMTLESEYSALANELSALRARSGQIGTSPLSSGAP